MVASVKFKLCGGLGIKLERKTIGKRLIITNFIILLISLVAFFTFVMVVFRSQSLHQEGIYLIEENANFSRNITNTEFKTAPLGSTPAGARYFHIWYYNHDYDLSKINEDFKQRVNVLQRHNANIDFLSDLMLESKLEELSEEPQKIIVNDQVYLAVSNTNAEQFIPGVDKPIGMTLVTLVPYEEVLGLNMQTIGMFATLLIVLATISGVLMYIQAKNITKPIEKLKNITKSYANRDFSESLIVDTGDEIEDLSISIQKMVYQLKYFEKSQISLFRNLSHELKTPLTAISGYAEGLELGRFEDTSAPLKIIQDESIRIKNILEDLIFLSKINSNSEVYSYKRINVVDIVIKSLEKVESIAIMNDIDLEFIPCEEIFVQCDEDKMVRAFINILSNSLKYGKDLIDVKIVRNGTFVDIVFTDNGEGFKQDILDKILEKPLDTTLNGNGLGIMIVKEIVNIHKGILKIENNEATGARVTISLQIV